MDFFSVTCTTCHAKLKVRSTAAIGQILACPKCESMVQITPPPGWVAPQPSAAAAPTTAVSTSAAPPAVAAHAAGIHPVGGLDLTTPPSAPLSTAAPPPGSAITSATPSPPEHAATPAQLASGAAVTPPPPPPLAPSAAWQSPAEKQAQRLLLWGAGGGIGLICLSVITLMWLTSGEEPPPSVAVADAPPSVAQAAAPDQVAPPLAPRPTLDAPAAAPAKQPGEASEPSTAPKPVAKTPEDATPAKTPAVVAPVEPPAQEVAADGAAQEAEEEYEPLARPMPLSPFAEPGTPPVVAKIDPLDNLSDSNPPPDAQDPTAAAPADSEEPAPVAESLAVRRVATREGQAELDVAQQLADVLPAIELRNVPLRDFVRFFSDLTTLPVSLDLPSLRSSGIALDAPIAVREQDAAVATVLTTALSAARLTYTSEDEQIVVTTNQAPREVRFRVEDLVGEELSEATEFAELLQQCVAPHTWQAAGGQGTIQVGVGELVLTQTPAVLYESVIFCERLRIARGLPHRSKLDPRKFELEPRAALVAPKLSRQVTFTFHEPTSLSGVTRYMESQANLNLLLDWRSLRHEELLPTSQITCSIHERTLADALAAILGPLNLDWRVIDADTLEIFSQHDAAAKAQCEFYPVKRLIAAGQEGEALLTAIRRETGERNWQSGGGLGVLRYDAASQAVLVRHNQFLQDQVAQVLAALGQKLVAER